MLTRVKQFFTGPVLEDEYQTSVARILNVILLAIFAVTVIGTIAIIPFEPDEWIFNLTFGIVISILVLGLRWFLYRGRILIVSVVISSILWISITALLTFGGVGVNDPVFTGYFLVIAIAGLILGGGGALIFGILSIIVALGLLYAGNIGLPIVSAGEAPPLAVNMITLTITMGLTTLLLRFAMRNMNESLNNARKNEQAQIEANRELENIRATLEQRIANRTSKLEQQAVQLQIATEVGRAATTIRDIKKLLPQVAQLIGESFGFYHIGIFLISANNEYAVLKAATSEGGQKMLDRGHRLKIGGFSIVGHVTAKREARIALDVGEDAVFFDNPDLPETRSEMALPLIAGDELLGVIDVQSKREAAFSNEDISVLQTLADQIAIAIENARLLTERQEALATAQRAYGERSQKAWGELLRSQPELGFLSTLAHKPLPTTGDWEPGMRETIQRGEITTIDKRTIAIPIILRDQVLGVVRLQKSKKANPWNDNEIELMDSLIDQLELALESARLYRETQQRAERERLVTDITTKIRSTTDPEQMLKTAVEELKLALNANQAHFVIPQAESETKETT
ncbi:MAG: hypothetical protein B6I38_00980 [Anaerolineaceae bacterium 4572_5.1]|nr:MAG: hypothetical protein B6I38_00980 [Anaerolineaceae bacterium 4572_5.1]